ncbi:serine esterase family member protein [Theileria equi strain WA]|uniref:Serine esterase family member protein n=1 Tax=Theileria equi strain WA TaxID=1537102 RepID=L0ATZ1_THEEQ|nr:serine esterase family member protein [Theileria equi strain WA]AFZ79010.1 serine esterase family member protein [Theileria equi strain WA]|eukprot:XP_004828676.1 serine esterase family member protein [Theileria equi strain WA]
MFNNCKCDFTYAHGEVTKDNIKEIAKRLASEVNCRIQSDITYEKLGRLTFIGHSMGGLIVREALQYLEYKEKLYTFITISTPHIGYPRYMRSVLKPVALTMKSEALKCISMNDAEDKRESFIYQLSKDHEISNFEKIILIGIKEDYQAFLYSSLINATKLNSGSKISCEMEKNIMENIKNCEITRITFSYAKISHYLEKKDNRWIDAHNDIVLNRVMVRLILAVNSSIF